MSGNLLFRRWSDLYQAAYLASGEVGSLECASCGESALRMLFVVSSLRDENGTVAFWCESCQKGLAPNRALIPGGARRVLVGHERIPNYSVISE